MFIRSFFNNQQTQTESILELEEAVARLTLENHNIKNRLRSLEERLQTNPTNRNQSDTTSGSPTTIQATVVEESPSRPLPTQLCINDKVRIKNPKKLQTNKGTIIGITPSSFVKVELNKKQGTIRNKKATNQP